MVVQLKNIGMKAGSKDHLSGVDTCPQPPSTLATLRGLISLSYEPPYKKLYVWDIPQTGKMPKLVSHMSMTIWAKMEYTIEPFSQKIHKTNKVVVCPVGHYLSTTLGATYRYVHCLTTHDIYDYVYM